MLLVENPPRRINLLVVVLVLNLLRLKKSLPEVLREILLLPREQQVLLAVPVQPKKRNNKNFLLASSIKKTEAWPLSW